MNKYSIAIVFNNMNKKVIIYGLFNPFNGDCFYIGKTIRDLNTRLFEHINEKGTNLNKDRIINNIIRQGKQPLIKELLTVDDYYINELDVNYWEYVEKYFIKFTREVLKEPIVNIASGGEGGCGSMKKTVLQYDLNGNYIKTFNSVTELRESLKSTLNCKALKDTLRGKKLYYKGYQYRFIDDNRPVLINLKEYKNKSIKVLQYDLNNNLLNIYDSYHQAAKAINKLNGQGNISDACNNKKLTAYGYKWKYEIN